MVDCLVMVLINKFSLVWSPFTLTLGLAMWLPLVMGHQQTQLKWRLEKCHKACYCGALPSCERSPGWPAGDTCPSWLSAAATRHMSEAILAPVVLLDDCTWATPGRSANEPPSWAQSKLLAYRIMGKKNSCSFKPLHFKVVFYAVTDNWFNNFKERFWGLNEEMHWKHLKSFLAQNNSPKI